MIREYYKLSKPGIVYGNLLPAVAAFTFGSTGVPDFTAFMLMCVGLSSIIACGCVLNNYLDRHMDALMERTKNRALVRGVISSRAALLFSVSLGLVGAGALLLVNYAALSAALFGLFVYVALYTPLKPVSASALFVGAVAGAMPPVVGYTAAAGVFDVYALWLFAALYFWQLPHFIAIAYFRYDEYVAAGVPLIVTTPPSKEARKTAKKIFIYSLWALLFGCAALIVHTWIR
jgi:protoheme IX farnesyltransferase